MNFGETTVCAALAAVALGFWLLDYLYRRIRAREIFRASQQRVPQVNVSDVIARETEDAETREEILARLSPAMRYYELRRYEWLWRWLKPLSKDARVLDAGCGDGFILQETAKQVADASIDWFGTDISLYKVERARERLRDRAHVSAANVEQLPFRADAFQIILCTEVLEHLLKVEPGVAEISRVCQANGRVLLSTPSRHSIFFSYTNPFTWLEALVGLFAPTVLPPFHNLERPLDPHSVVHRAFTFQEMRALLRAYDAVTIETCHYRMPGFVYARIRSPKFFARVEEILARIPLVNRLGETLLVCAVKR